MRQQSLASLCLWHKAIGFGYSSNNAGLVFLHSLRFKGYFTIVCNTDLQRKINSSYDIYRVIIRGALKLALSLLLIVAQAVNDFSVEN